MPILARTQRGLPAVAFLAVSMLGACGGAVRGESSGGESGTTADSVVLGAGGSTGESGAANGSGSGGTVGSGVGFGGSVGSGGAASTVISGQPSTSGGGVAATDEAYCVPPLTADAEGEVPCLVLVSLEPGSSAASAPGQTCTLPGYAAVDPTVLAEFKAGQSAAGTGLENDVTCALLQIPVPAGETCEGGSAPGWCYVTTPSSSSGSCAQSIVLTNDAIPVDAVFNLECIATSAGSRSSTH